MHTFGGKYRLSHEIGNGGCGTVFLGVHTVAGKEVAIKVEQDPSFHHDDGDDGLDRRHNHHSSPRRRRHAHAPSPLKHESRVYKSLMGGPGVPWIMWSGRKGGYNILVIDLLGPSLEDLFKICNRHFSLQTVLLLADQLLPRLEFIHSRDLVHRDIKPANFVMGTGKAANVVHAIDFGLAKKFRDPRTGLHIPYHQDDVHGVGTSLFASINTHMGIECSRRDDLESLSYMLIYFLRGTLPWRKIRYHAPEPAPKSDSIPSPRKKPSRAAPHAHSAPPSTMNVTPSRRSSSVSSSASRTKSTQSARPAPVPINPVTATWDLILAAKLQAESTLTAGLPAEFDVLHSYARALAFDDLPDYVALRKMFRTLGKRAGVVYPPGDDDDPEADDEPSTTEEPESYVEEQAPIDKDLAPPARARTRSSSSQRTTRRPSIHGRQASEPGYSSSPSSPQSTSSTPKSIPSTPRFRAKRKPKPTVTPTPFDWAVGAGLSSRKRRQTSGTGAPDSVGPSTPTRVRHCAACAARGR
ncbi:hypothetical protein HGRIS_010768 [Hohenbuehelia grisea]|uniref:non-specific serine/threonine protein kinase n=1 Tax=Hohenbuehelia grisea TaxID=104357 RepID=A0ABR3IY22_9AGAR